MKFKYKHGARWLNKTSGDPLKLKLLKIRCARNYGKLLLYCGIHHSNFTFCFPWSTWIEPFDEFRPFFGVAIGLSLHAFTYSRVPKPFYRTVKKRKH